MTEQRHTRQLVIDRPQIRRDAPLMLSNRTDDPNGTRISQLTT